MVVICGCNFSPTLYTLCLRRTILAHVALPAMVV